MIGLNFGLEEIENVKEVAKVDLTTAILVNIPTAAAIIYVVKLMLKDAQERRKEDKEERQAIGKVIDRNSNVLTSVAGTISRCKLLQEAQEQKVN